MARGKRIGLFGGTFDPIHSAHLTVAREAIEQAGLDEILFVPAAHPPHKSGATGASYEHRYRMVELACEGESRFVPSRLEEGEGKSYSIDTITRLLDLLAPEDRVFFLIGADAFAEITTWRRWESVLDAVDFIVVTRPGHKYDVPRGARVHALKTLALPVSSSEIRSKLERGEPTPELPEPVLGHILASGLYAQSPEAPAGSPAAQV
jgi:nicotinate-nucleotide adenylyltransferase